MARPTTKVSYTCPGSLVPGLARPNLGQADAPGNQSRRLHSLASYSATVAVARARGPTIADTTTIHQHIPR
jgi:hypothetical protein